MKLRHMMVSLVLVLAAGCDRMEQDVDGQMLSINKEPAYFLRNNDGYIDLASRVLSPGKVKIEITGSTRNGELKDLGKGLLQYSPKSTTSNDSFRFRVFSNDNQALAEDTIRIIITSDTTHLPCAVYTRNDSVLNVTEPVLVDVAANDYSCSAPLMITISVPPEHGTAKVVGTKIRYVPGPSFTGHDKVLYKATTSDPSMPAGYGMLWIIGPDAVSGCTPGALDDLFYRPKYDSSAAFMDVLANDTVCDSIASISITSGPHRGYAWIDNNFKKIGYKTLLTQNIDDTLRYQLCGPGGCATAQVIIKRQ